MTFGSSFGRTFSPTFQPRSQAAAVASSWWLAGGIAAANCIVAYQPKGAADMAASLVNLANPGTYNANLHSGVKPTQIPDFDTATGWSFDASNKEYLSAPYNASLLPVTLIARVYVGDMANEGAIFCHLEYSGGHYLSIMGNEKSRALKTNIAVIGSSTGAVSTSASSVLAFTFGDGSYAFYIDGSAGGTGSSAVTFDSGKTGQIGGASYGIDYPFNGYIYAAAVYNIALTGTQVAALSTAMAAL